MPPHSPFLPYFIGYQGNSIQASKQIDGVQAIQKLAKQVGAEVQQPNAIPGDNTLSKFDIMARVIRTMSADQLKKATENLYFPYKKASAKSSQDAQSYQAWTAFRDAVAQAGTGPALLTLKDWVISRKVEGQEAAELVSAIQNSARTPTPEYMDAFFSLATNEEVQKQWFLNTSAIMSFTNLVRKAQVNNDTAHNRYPSHAFGRLYPRKQAQKVVAEKYIPYLQSQLRKAVSQGDSPKIQVYIRALGNTAHPKILAVFEPYLEGKEPMSDFQRLTIVASMDKMTKTYPKLARSVLFKIYQNSGDASEVRTAAVMQLMKTNPPAQILQRMAQYTNSDHSDQVNSAVKSAIESAARLRTPCEQELAQNAKSAVDMLTPKNYGAQYSKNALRSYIVQEQQLGYQGQYAAIQSGDSNVPSSMFIHLRKYLGGYQRQEFQASYMTSSASDLMDLLQDQYESSQSFSSSHKKSGSARHSQSGSNSSPWSIDKLTTLLNIDMEDADQVEGNLLLSTLSGKKFFAFDNHTIEQIPRLAREAASHLRSEQHFNFTKLYNQFSAKIGFPTATGLPFVFSFSVPAYAYVGGSIQAKSHPDIASSKDKIQVPSTVNVTADVEITYSAKAQGKMGFITPYNHKRYTAALHKNIHVHLPLRAWVDIDVENANVTAKLQPIEANKKHKLFEYSTVAYTAKHDILDLQPELNANDVEIIHVRSPRRNETTVGQDSTGFAFDVKIESEQKFLDWATPLNALRRHDAISALIYTTAEQSINNNNVTVTYNPDKSSAKYAKISASYDSVDLSSDDSAESGNRQSHNKHRGSEERGGARGNTAAQAKAAFAARGSSQSERQLRQAAAGIEGAYLQIGAVHVEFSGNQYAQYAAAVACGSSAVTNDQEILAYAQMEPAKNGKEYKMAAAVKVNAPNVPLANYHKAIESDPTSYVEAAIVFGESSSSSPSMMTLQGKLRQSSERRDFIRHHPLSAVCEQQMQQGNYIQPACRNATAAANMLDQGKFTIQYERVSESVKNATYKAYALARYFGNLYASENIVNPHGKQGQVEFEVNLGKDLQSVNVSMVAPAISAAFENIPLYPYVAAAIAPHPEYNAADRVGQYLLQSQQFPTCAIDKNQATSFDNKTYPLNLDQSWHLMALSMPKPHYDSDSGSSSSSDYDVTFAILVRQISSDKKEIGMILGDDYVQILAQSEGQNAGTVKFNGRKANFDTKKSDSFQDKNGNTVIQVIALPTGTVRVVGEKHGIEMLYDGQRVKLQVSNAYRGQMIGLCGTFDKEEINDFTSPKNCVLRNPFEFAASYAIPDSSQTGRAKELRQRAENADCYKQQVMLGDVISENEAGRKAQRPSSKSSNSPHSKSSAYSASALKVKVVHANGQTCFSKRPQLACQSPSQESKPVTKNLEFYCVSDPTAARRWEEQIKKGASPDFSRKPTNYQASVRVPSACKA